MADNFSGSSPVPAQLGGRQLLALGALGASFLMIAVDSTTVYVAIPSIQRGLAMSTASVQWLMSAFLISFGGVLLLSPGLTDLFGRRRLFTTGVAVVTATSLLSAVAWSGGVLIVARGLQGAGAALVATTALPLLALALDSGPARSRALGLWTVIGAFGGTAGLLLGGLLIDGPGWRWVFLVNVPVGIIAAFLAAVLPPDPCVRSGHPLDVAGAASLIGAMALIGWTIVGAFAAQSSLASALLRLSGAIVLLRLFVAFESRAPRPLVRPGLLRSRTRLAGLVVLFTAGTVVEGILLMMTFYGQESLGLSAAGFGVLMVALTLPSMIGSYAGQAMVLRHGLGTVAMTGMALAGAGLLALATVRGSLAIGSILTVLPVIGVGAGAAFVAAQIAVTLGAEDADSPATSGLTDASFSMGGAIGLAVVSAALVAHHPAPASAAAHPPGVTGLQTALALAAGLAAVGLLAALLLRRSIPVPTRRLDM